MLTVKQIRLHENLVSGIDTYVGTYIIHSILYLLVGTYILHLRVLSTKTEINTIIRETGFRCDIIVTVLTRCHIARSGLMWRFIKLLVYTRRKVISSIFDGATS